MRTTALLIAAALLLVVATQQAGAYALINGPWWAPSNPVEYRLNNVLDEHCIPGQGELDEVRISFQTWEDVTEQTLDFQEGAYTTSCGGTMDGISAISFEDCLNQCSGSVIAVTYSYYWGSGGDASWCDNCVGGPQELWGRKESDITYSDTYSFGTHDDALPPCGNGCGSNIFDVRSITVHEIGHFLGLGHSTVGGATMYASVGYCQTWMASLHSDDMAGLRCLYDDDYVPMQVQDLDAGSVVFSMLNTGNICVSGTGEGVPGQYGSGFQYPAGVQNVYEGSILFGTGADDPVSDDYRQSPSAIREEDNDTYQTSEILFLEPSDVSDQMAQCSFDDEHAESPYGIEVIATSHAFQAPPNNDFVILCYKLANNSGSAINGLRVGLVMDWDFNNVYQTNSVSYEADIDLGVISDPSTSNKGGITVLNPEGALTFRAVGTSDNWTDSDKASYLFSGFAQTSRGPEDIGTLIATGDFNIAAGDTAYAGFAILGGTSVVDLRANATQAQTLWEEVCGAEITTDVATVGSGSAFALSQNVPNPFNPMTQIEFELDRESMVWLRVFDAAGREVRSLIDGVRRSGNHTISWDGRDNLDRELPSGMYFYTLETGSETISRKMVLLK